MKTYILVNLKLHGFPSRQIESLDIYGIISAQDENCAADSISCKVTHYHRLESLKDRYYLDKTTSKSNQWFLEEVEPISAQTKIPAW